MNRYWLAALLGLLIMAGCGYRFGGPTVDLPAGIETLYVARFENRTSEPYLDSIMTGSMVERLVRQHNLELVEKPVDADAVLAGEVVQYQVAASAYDAADDIRSYRVTMKVRARLERQADGRIIWQDEAVRFRDFVSTGVGITEQEGLERDARKEVAARLAEDLSWQMATGFGAE